MSAIKNTGLPPPMKDPTANAAIARADKARKVKLPIPTESQEQKWLFEWKFYARRTYPELALLHAIPNGGFRNKVTAARLKAEGVCPGVPDLCLPVPRGGFYGLYIELKRRKGGKLSDDQAAWIRDLGRQGYCVKVCRGWEEAKDVIIGYLES